VHYLFAPRIFVYIYILLPPRIYWVGIWGGRLEAVQTEGQMGPGTKMSRWGDMTCICRSYVPRMGWLCTVQLGRLGGRRSG
jgi:hypothetical protein